MVHYANIQDFVSMISWLCDYLAKSLTDGEELLHTDIIPVPCTDDAHGRYLEAVVHITDMLQQDCFLELGGL